MANDPHPAKIAKASSNAEDPVRTAYFLELREYRTARAIGEVAAAWRHLERAHILAQPRLWLHMGSQTTMFAFAFSRRDIREMSGQLLRVALVPIGALTGRLLVGNTGRARISAFAPMPVPEDLQPYVMQDAS